MSDDGLDPPLGMTLPTCKCIRNDCQCHRETPSDAIYNLELLKCPEQRQKDTQTLQLCFMPIKHCSPAVSPHTVHQTHLNSSTYSGVQIGSTRQDGRKSTHMEELPPNGATLDKLAQLRLLSTAECKIELSFKVLPQLPTDLFLPKFFQMMQHRGPNQNYQAMGVIQAR